MGRFQEGISSTSCINSCKHQSACPHTTIRKATEGFHNYHLNMESTKEEDEVISECFWSSPLYLFGECVQWLMNRDDWDLTWIQNIYCCFNDIHEVTNHSHGFGLVVEQM